MTEHSAIWLLRNDLRIHDNYAIVHLTKMIESGKASFVIPTYCYDPRHFACSEVGLKQRRIDSFRTKFLTESLADLRESLRRIGSDLLVVHGRPEDVIPHLMREVGAKTVVLQSEVAWEDRLVEDAVAAAVSSAGGSVDFIWGSTLYHLDDLPFSSAPSSSGSLLHDAQSSQPGAHLVKTLRPDPAADVALLPSSRGAFNVQVASHPSLGSLRSIKNSTARS
jgi:deoxyribodipyrimidine photo-lyase